MMVTSGNFVEVRSDGGLDGFDAWAVVDQRHVEQIDLPFLGGSRT